MGERIDIDGVRFKVDADLSKLKEGLKEGEKAGREAGAKTGDGFAKGFGGAMAGIAAAFAGSKVISYFKSATDEANKLEKTMLGLQATAKLTGNSFEALKGQVTSLAKDGVVSIDQAATSMKTLLAQGIQADKAFQLLDAAKKVSSFNNIVGDAGQGVADFVKFLQTGSAELAENMDPSIVKVVKSLGGYTKVSSDATAKQKLINAVIEKGGKLTGDYEKFLNSGAQSQVTFNQAGLALSQTIGQKLQPAFSSLLKIGTGIVSSLTSFVDGLSSSNASILALTPVIVSIGLAAGAAGAQFGLMWASLLGPISLVVAGILAVSVALNEMTRRKTSEELVKGYKEQKTELKNLAAEADKLNAAHKRTAAEELKLIDTKEQLKKKARELGVDFDTLAAKAKNYGDIVKGLNDAQRDKDVGAIDTQRADNARNIAANERLIKSAEAAAGRSATDIIASGGRFVSTTGAGVVDVRKALLDRDRYANSGKRLDLDRATYFSSEEEKKMGAGGAATGDGKAAPEFRFIQARDALIELQKEYDKYIKKVGAESEKGKEAGKRYVIESTAIRSELRGAIAEYNEDRTMAAIESEQAAFDQARANVYKLAEAEKLSKEDVEKRIQGLRESHARRTAAIQAESFARTAQAASQMASGFSQAVNAKDAGGALSGFGGFAQGVGGLSDKFKSFGVFGQGIAAVGGVVSTLSGLFGKSDEQRAREAESQKRRDEEAKAILELQANYQKNMLALQESQAKLPFENLQRQLRLIDINAQSARVSGGSEADIERQRMAQRQAAIQSTLQSESGSIAGGALFGGVQGDPASLTKFLSERAAQSAAIAQFLALINGAFDVSPQQVFELERQAATYSGLIPPEIYGPVMASFARFRSVFSSVNSLDTQRSAYQDIRGAASSANALASEVNIDTARAESLLSVIEQQLQTQQDIAKYTKATADKLSETPTRQSSIIDIARGYSRSLGAVLSPSLTNTGLPQSISAAVLATDIQKSIQERSVKGIEDLVVIQRDSRELLAIIGKSLNAGTNANSSFLVQLEDLYRRSLAA